MHNLKPLLTLTSALCWLGALLAGLAGQGGALPVLAQTDRAAGTADEELVYLDPSGFIRVLDADLVSRLSEIQWVSPEGGWRDIALGDFNADGDAEIVAVGGEDQTAKLAIYDPVVADIAAVNVNRTINEIPWNLLYYTSTISSTLAVGRPTRVAAGNLDLATPGDELVLNVTLPSGAAAEAQLMIWHRLTTTATTQFWQPQIRPVDFDHNWSAIRIGEIDNSGVPEIALVDDNNGVLRVYRLDNNGLTQLYDNESNDRPWTDAAIGQTYTGDFGELVGVRNAPIRLPSMVVLRYLAEPDDDVNFKDQLLDYFDPSPLRVFLANVNGQVTVKDGGVDKVVDDEEIFLLRTVPPPIPPAVQTRPHLFMRNPGEDKNLPRFEVVLDADNGYQAGVGGEFDGTNGKEIAIMRNNRIRIYLGPESNTNSREYAANSNSQTLRSGNIDALGYPRLPKLVARPTQVALRLPAGEASQMVITVTNEGNINTVPFNIQLLGDPTWLRASPANGRTPTPITLIYDAHGLPPVTDFQAVVRIVPDDPQVPGRAVDIPVSLRTLPGLWPTPNRVVGLIDCTTRASRSYQVRVAGLLGVPYTANLNDFVAGVQSAAAEPLSLAPTEPYTVVWPSTVSWASVSGLGTVLPTTLTVTFNPSPENWPGTLLQGQLSIQAPNNQGQSATIGVPVAIVCQGESYYLPWISRR